MPVNKDDVNQTHSTGKPRRGLFVTGTDTGVGKTYVAAGIARVLHQAGHLVGVYKPAASGCQRDGDKLIVEDALRLWQAAGNPKELDAVCPQAFEAPLAPHLAARAEGRELDTDLLIRGIQAWHDVDIVIVEGAGGLMSPLGDDIYVADIAFELDYPLIVVAPNTIGVINQTLQTLITATTFRDGLNVAGIVLNDQQPDSNRDPSRLSNLQQLQSRCIPPILAHVGWNESIQLAEGDWLGVSG